MKISSLLTLAAGLLGIMTAPGAVAQTTSCDEIVFTGEVARRFPNAKDACIEVATRADGKQYAHFEAELRRHRGGAVFVRFNLPDGTTSRTYTFTPSSNARVSVGGQQFRWDQLVAGQEFDVWVPNDDWHFVVHETAEELVAAPVVETITIIEVVEEEPMPASLPATASPLPLIGLFGTAMLSLGGLVTWYRRRFSA